MNGKWITCDSKIETPLFRRTFTAQGATRAVIEISGLGYFTLWINGVRASDDWFAPAFTNYAPRDMTRAGYPIRDTMATRALFCRYDIARLLRDGENVIEIAVGNGWFRQRERACEWPGVYSESLVAAYELKLADAAGERTILSDGSEECFVYPILDSNLYLGDTIDTRLFDAPLQRAETRLSDFAPETVEEQTCPPERVIREIHPRLVRACGDRRIYDAGENISGIVQVRVRGRRGEKLVLRFAERMRGGEIDPSTTGAEYTCTSGRRQIQTDVFILNGREQEIEPMFAYHAFRYFEIAGEAELLEPVVKVIHTDVPVESTFECDCAAVNWLYDAYIRTQLNNLHGGIPSDCPHRERLGYTGDGQCCAEAAMLTLGMKDVYPKWIQDILDCQGAETGHVQHTAPLMGGGGGPGGWGCAIAIVPWQYYLRYGDKGMLERAYPAMKRWLAYMESHCEGGLFTHEEPDGWCLGDWATPGPVEIPEAFVNTCYLVKVMEILNAVAQILNSGERFDAEPYRRALRERYFDGAHYAGGVRAADAFAIWAKLPESETLGPGLCARYEALGRFDTGFLGTDILCQVLFEMGRGDVAMRLIASDDTGAGFGFMRARNATTIFEYIDRDDRSLDHPMFGACVRQLFTGLLGIRQRAGTAGYSDIVIAPVRNTLVCHASGGIRTAAGELRVAFDAKSVCVCVPEGLRASLLLNGREIALKGGETRILL